MTARKRAKKWWDSWLRGRRPLTKRDRALKPSDRKRVQP